MCAWKEDTSPGTWLNVHWPCCCFDPLQVQCAIFLWPTSSVLAPCSYTVDKNSTAAIFPPMIARCHAGQRHFDDRVS